VWTQPGVRFIRQFSCEDGALQARAATPTDSLRHLFSRRDRKRKNLRHQNSLKNNRKIVARRRRRTNLCNKATLHQEYTRLVKYLVFEPRTQVFNSMPRLPRLQQRIGAVESSHSSWKFSLADVEERKFWKRYMSAFEGCLSATSTGEAPWYVVPADDKENARLIVSQIILDTLNGLEMTYPEMGAGRRAELRSIRERLIKGDLK
jgi:Polyphosphate kinase 2 (PPK2)